MTNSDSRYSELSCSLTKKLSKSEKKDMGIFFTPPTCILSILQQLKQFVDISNSKTNHKFKILEPSCGSGEFIEALNKHILLIKSK